MSDLPEHNTEHNDASCKPTAAGIVMSAVMPAVISIITALATITLSATAATAADLEDIATRLQRAYPDHITGSANGDLIWRDGTRMPLSDGGPEKSFDAWLATPDIADMFRIPYPSGAYPSAAATPAAPAPNHDPGRARNAAFFKKMYGDCTRGGATKNGGKENGSKENGVKENGVTKNLTTITWLPNTAPTKLQVTRINGVAEKVERISRELDALGPSFTRFLSPPAGTYVCRPIAGTNTPSAHGYGIAIDIAIKYAHYWRWQKDNGATPVWRNDIPAAIIAIFERHGFIWGGRWHHYDTMHFEYRPELLPDAR